MKIPAKHTAKIAQLEQRYPFIQPLSSYYMGVSGTPEGREQKAFMDCLRCEFADILGYSQYTEKYKGKVVGKEVWRALIVATADFYSRGSGARQMEEFHRKGYQSGTPDILIAVKQPPYSGVVIEMKALRGYASANQKKTLQFLRTQGFSCHVCQGFLEALDVWLTYLGY